jgi:hypothetical protein
MAVDKDKMTIHLQKTNPGLVSEEYYSKLTPTEKAEYRKVGFLAIPIGEDTGNFVIPGHRIGKVRKCYY